MSISIMNRVWEKSTQKGSALLLTIALADNANHDGVCYPGIDYLKKKIRMSERATERLLDTLVDAGEIYRKVGRGRGQRTQYAILTTLDKDSIVNLLQKYAEQFSLSNGDAEKHADEIIEKRRQYDTLKSERKQRRSETSKSVKKTSNSSKKGVVTERKTPTTVEPSSSNTNTDSNSSELESFAPASQDATSAPQDTPKEQIPPQGYRWLCSSVSDSLMHLIPAVSNDKSARPLCKASVPHRVAYNVRNLKPSCAECLRIAANPPKKPEKAKALSSQPVFDALAEVVFGITDPTDIGELGGRVGPIRERLIGHVLKKRGVPDLDEPTLVELASHIKRFAKWYDEQCKGCPRPASPDKFMSHWVRYTKKAASQANKPYYDAKAGEWRKAS